MIIGSGITMLDGFRNLIEYGVQPEDAVRMASANPARIMKQSDRGMIVPGYAADLNIMDKNFNLVDTMIGGKFVREKKHESDYQKDYDDCSLWAANYVAYKIKAFRPTKDKPFVLGLPTGSTPLGMYRLLIEMVKEGKLSFANVVTFNMDEYIGLPPAHPQSYHYFMEENFSSILTSGRKTSIC